MLNIVDIRDAQLMAELFQCGPLLFPYLCQRYGEEIVVDLLEEKKIYFIEDNFIELACGTHIYGSNND